MMFSLAELLPFMLMVTGMAILPGPNMMLYLSHTVNYGRKAGWLTVAGITSAFIVHISATILGLTALLLAMPTAYTALKYAGIGYLLYLAWKNYSAKPATINKKEDSAAKASFFFYLKGFVGNVLNPQTTLLYFSLLPQFLHPERGKIWLQNIQLGLIQMCCSTLTNLTVVYITAKITGSTVQKPSTQIIVRHVVSILLALFAIKMAFTK